MMIYGVSGGIAPQLLTSAVDGDEWSALRPFIFIYYLVCEVIDTSPTPGLLCQPRMIVKMIIVEKQMECRLTGETEVLGENLPQRHFVHHKIPHDQTPV
jgi:hypothetical protein